MSKATVFDVPMITCYSGSDRCRITEEELIEDVDSCHSHGIEVHQWSGRDPQGQAYGVLWMLAPDTGCLLNAYEVSEGH